MKNEKKIQTEEKRIIELLLKEGFRELTKEERKSDWYKKEMEPISCETESEEEFEEEFEKLCAR